MFDMVFPVMSTTLETNKFNPQRATPGQVARHLSVTAPTVLAWFRDGIIPAKIAVGRIYRFDIEEVDAALAKRSAKGGAK